MIPSFKSYISISYFFLLCSYAVSFCIKNTQKTDKKLQEEIAPVLEKYNECMNNVDPETKKINEIEFLVQLNSLGRKAMKYDQLLKDYGRLEGELETRDKVLRILPVRSRIEDLGKILYPFTLRKDISVRDMFQKILESDEFRFTNSTAIIQFRDRVLQAGLTFQQFLDVVERINGLFDDKAAQNIIGIAPSPPNFDDETSISEMLLSVRIIPDKPVVSAVKVILEPLPMPSVTKTTTAN